MRQVTTPLKSTGWDCLSPMKRRLTAYLECAYNDASGTWEYTQGSQDSGPNNVGRIHCHESLRAVLTPQNTIVLSRPYEHAAHFSRSCEAESLPAVPEPVFVASIKAAVYANGFYVAPHHSALQLDIHVTAFSSRDTGTERYHEAAVVKFRVYVNSAPARQGVKALDAFVSAGLEQETPRRPFIDHCYPGTKSEMTSISMLDLDCTHDYMTSRPVTSSFLGLIVGEDKETTMVIPDGPCTVDSVTSASCEVLARCLGWHVEKRAIGDRELANFSEAIATTAGLRPIRSITVKSQARVLYQYAESSQGFGEGYKLLSMIFDDIILGKTAHDFGWNVHSVYDTRFDVYLEDKRFREEAGKRAASTCKNDEMDSEDFYFALLPARRFCN